MTLFLSEDMFCQQTFGTSFDSIEGQNRRLYVEYIDCCYSEYFLNTVSLINVKIKDINQRFL